MSRSPTRTLQVINTQALTPNMQRLTLGGEKMANFPAGQEGVYIKLMFPQDSNDKPLVRTYTIIQQRSNELDVDFVLHSPPHGPASTLAINAKIGDQVMLSGPGAKKSVYTEADWFFIAGDMTALPAISVILKNLPKSAKGYVVLEIIDDADRQSLILPDDMEVHWVTTKTSETALNDKVKSLPFLAGSPSVWVACEFSTMRSLRKYFKIEHGIEKKALYISSYWKKGLAEDKHKLVKREDAEGQSN